MASKYELEAVFNLIDSITKPLDKIGANSKTVTDKLKRDFTATQKKVDVLGKSFVKWGKRAILAVGAAAAASIGFVIKKTMALADTMAKIGTVADATAPPLSEIQKNLTDVANQAGFTVKELAEIAYAAIPCGIAAEASATFAAVVAKTAKITGTSADKIIGSMDTVMDAYGMATEEAARVSGILFTASKLGGISIEEMGTGMRNVIPIAAQYGVVSEDVFASVTALATQGLTAKDAMKTLGDSISAVTHPSKDAAALAQRLGLDFSEAAVRSKGWAGFLDDLRKKTGGNQRIMEKLFGNEKVARSMSILATTGAQAFSNALSEMGNAMNTIDEQFAKVTDTPAERWKKAINKIQNAGISLGTSLLPIVERVIGKVTEIADRLTAIDFSQYSSQIDEVFRRIEGMVSGFINLIKFAWQFRGVIMAIVIPLALYQGILMAIAIFSGPVKAAIFALTLTMGDQAAALGMLKSGTLRYLVVDKLFTAATVIRNTILNLLTGGTLAQAAATASMAVATGTATKGQWLLNAAMTANPIGLVIGIILVLILVLKELFSNWENIVKAFQDGGILAGILRMGGTIVSAILAPIQALLELLSKIPGMGSLAGKGADKIQEFRNFLKGTNDIANTAQNRKATEKSPTSEIDELLKQFDTTIPAMDDYQRQLDSLEMPDFDIPGLGGLSGASKLHGVEDISKGPSTITHYYAAAPGTNTSPVPALGGIPGTQTVSSAVSLPAVVDNTPQALLSIDRTVQTITALMQSLDTTATAILNKPAPVITANMPALRIPAQAVRTPYKPPAVPRRYNETDQREQEEADQDDPRRIAPVTREERMAYSLQERRETVNVEVSAAPGSQARVVRQPKAPNIRLTTSGGNA